MSEKQLIGAIGSAILMVLMFLGMPIWLCMTLVGVVGYVIMGGAGVLTTMGLTALGSVENYTFAVMPVFLLMGELADISGMMKEAYRSANILLGRLRGGLAMASLVGAAAFSLVINASGMVNETIVPLLTAEEIDQACKKSIAYRAPGA